MFIETNNYHKKTFEKKFQDLIKKTLIYLKDLFEFLDDYFSNTDKKAAFFLQHNLYTNYNKIIQNLNME